MSDFEVEGEIDVAGAVERIIGSSAAALQVGADLLLERANEEVPRDSGDLADSATAEVSGDEATVSYGEYYGPIVHERNDPWFARVVDQAGDEVAAAMRAELEL